MIYTLEQLSEKIAPIAEKYNIPAVYVFGSYARGEATEDSDVDLLIQDKGSAIKSLFDLGGLYHDLNEALQKNLDIVEEGALGQKHCRRTPWLAETIMKERVHIYGATRLTADSAHSGILRGD